jgi:hypothetical protein
MSVVALSETRNVFCDQPSAQHVPKLLLFCDFVATRSSIQNYLLMAPSGRATRPGRAPAPVQRKGNTNANAVAGFAKRQARKATATAKGPALSDVYEFQQAKQRRSRVSVDTRLGREEAAEFGFGHGEENEEDGARQEMRARLIGENDDDEGLGSDEDEEIDSDVAFEEEDEDRYAGFNFSSSKVRPSAHYSPSVQV